MILFALDDERVRGPINATSPYFTTLGELARTAASVIGRPTIRVPFAAVKAAMGGAADVIVGSQRVFPKRAVELGYEFHHARLLPALEASLMAEAS
jgi:NAD dependent epimerase/dehydratase family enzyme